MPCERAADAPTFGDLLRRHRRARELSQEALAERAGVSARAISDLERGARAHPYRGTAARLADALNLAGSERAALLATARRVPRPQEPTLQEPCDTRFPKPLTALFGRDRECGEIAALLRDEKVRLLTLTGPAGVGKTRLAVAVADELGDAFPDGVVFVDLAPLREPGQVMLAVAAALDLADQGAIPAMEAVRRRLSTRRMLLVLDNFEHLLAAAPALSDLLQSAPGVQALTTSRAALRLRGEREYPVMPLPTPDPLETIPLGDLGRWAAIQLFVERASQTRPGFRLAAENAAAVAAICGRLDGLPLALELAAARIKLLPPDVLLERLEHRLLLLTAGMRDAPPRQRTLLAAIAWSYDLLDPPQQALLRSLAVFAGGWTLDAAEFVAAANGAPDAIDALAGLVEQNLVVRDDRGIVHRYRMLETVREFAGDRLRASGEEPLARGAHLRYLLWLARENDLERLDAEVGARLDRLKTEEANLRAGIEWGIEHDAEAAVAVLAELDWFWYLADRPGVGRVLHERALETDVGKNLRARSRLLQQAAWLAGAVGDFAELGPLADAARGFATALGDARTLAYARMHEGDVAMSHGDGGLANSLLQDALAQFEALDDAWGTMVCLTGLGITAQDRGDPSEAVAWFERVGAITAERQLPAHHQAHVLVNLAYSYRQLGREEEAFATSQEALRLAREAGRTSVVGVVQGDLARLLLERGDTARAAARAAESLGLLWEIGNNWLLAQALERAAFVLAAGGRAASAARLFAAAAGLRAAMPYPIGAGDQETLAYRLAQVRAALGEVAFADAWVIGQTHPVEAIVAEARMALATMAG
jgi:predicted ATPase/DNA-binding XRE family transcriptional regulator